MKYLIAISLLILVSCTDAARGRLASYGESSEVTCFSGGKEIFKATSTGKVGGLGDGGWAFKTQDGRYIQTYADCFVTVK